MNLTQLLDASRLLLDDVVDAGNPGNTLWGDAELTRYADETEREAARRAGLLIDATTAAVCRINLLVGVNSYALHGKVLDVLRAKPDLDSAPLRLVTRQWLDERLPGWQADTGDPAAYYMEEAGKIAVYPTPTRADTLWMRVTRLPLWDFNALGSESLSETDFATHARWDVTGGMTDSGGAATYTHAAGTGTLTQAAANLATAGVGNRRYKFTYAVSGITAGCAAQITAAFAATAQPLTLAAGTQTLVFQSAESPGPFVVSVTSTAGGFTLDNVSLKEEKDTPEIAERHHFALAHGICKWAYLKQDAETEKQGKAAIHEAEFTRHFGLAVTALGEQNRRRIPSRVAPRAFV